MGSIGTSQYTAPPCSKLLVTSDNLLNLCGSVPLPLKIMRVEPKLGPSSVTISENLEGKSEPLPTKTQAGL